MFSKYNRLMTAVIIILAVGFVATSLISYTVSRSSLRNEITFSSLPLTSDNIYSEIQRDLLPPVFISSLMANDTFVRDWVMQGERNDQDIVRYLTEIKKKYGTVSAFFVSDKSGKYYHSDGILKTIRQDDPRDAWYYRVKDMVSNYEINIDPDMANADTMTIFINYKVYDYKNNFIGATGVGLTVNAVKKLIGYYQEKYQRTVFFVDKKGGVTLRSSDLSNGEDSILKIEGIQDYASKILASETGFTFSYHRGPSEYFLNTRFIKEFNWYLLVEENVDIAGRILVRTLFVNIAISLFITGIIFLLIRLQIKDYRRKIELLATTDKLTGLYNRQAFDVIMEQALKERKRDRSEMTLLMMDLDFFKTVNDNYGHLCGDEVLIRASERIKDAIRESDVLCRWGGEEFFVLIKNCGFENAKKSAEKIRLAFEEKLFSIGPNNIPLTVSIGLTLFAEDDTYEKAVTRADQALYAAKAAGRNTVKIA